MSNTWFGRFGHTNFHDFSMLTQNGYHLAASFCTLQPPTRAGTVLGSCRHRAGIMLASCWHRAGIVLVWCWNRAIFAVLFRVRTESRFVVTN